MALDPIRILQKKEEYAHAELKKDEPLLILISLPAVLCMSAGTSKAHQKIIPLVPNADSSIILCARGNPSDLVVFKREIRSAITQFEKTVSAADLCGRMIAMAAAEILRNYYLKEPKALAVQAAFLDFSDPEDPVCVISPTGEQFVGKNFLLTEAEIKPVADSPRTLQEMKEYAKSLGIPAEGTEHVWVFMSPMQEQTDAATSQENPPPADAASPQEHPPSEQPESAEHPPE